MTGLNRSIATAIAALSTAAAAVGSQLPGVSFFADFAPPSFKALTLLSGGGALAVFVRVFTSREAPKKRAQLGFRYTAFAIALAVAYSFVIQWVTVTSPSESGAEHRYQIGFGMQDFSLTAEAKAARREQSLQTPQELMLAFGAFQPGGAELIWREWTIVSAALLLSCLFVLTYLSWAYGLACISWSLIRRR